MILQKNFLLGIFAPIFLIMGLSLPLLSQSNEPVDAVSQNSLPLHDSNIVGNLAGSFSVELK